jgi:hypothetical protein
MTQLGFTGACRTTAMGIMPHRDVDRALELALSLDIPFWPQLPHASFLEDMYAQTSAHFPGIVIDTEGQRIRFESAKFEAEMSDYMEGLTDPQYLALGPDSSLVYPRFLEKDLSRYAAIRGQLTGPVSFGFKIEDESLKPVIYNETVRELLFDFIQRKVNLQYQQLAARNPNAFVWVDEPGLSTIFSALTGYGDIQAKADYASFLSGVEGPKGLHLCASVDLRFLTSLGADILSIDAYQLEFMPREYGQAAADFITRGGIIAWGIVPTDSAAQAKHSGASIAKLLTDYWEVVTRETGMALERIAESAWIAPARCCLVDIGLVDQACPAEPGGHAASREEQIVERSFAWIKEISAALKERFRL